MKRLLIGGLLLIASVSTLNAEYVLTADPQVVHEVGALDIYNPFLSPRAAYYYDLKTQESLVGGEFPLFGLYILEGTFGMATNIVEPNGANPFVGANIRLPNPLPAFASLDAIKPGIAAGWNIQRGDYIVALKAAVPFGS